MYTLQLQKNKAVILHAVTACPSCAFVEILHIYAGCLSQANPLDPECEAEGKIVCHNGHIVGEPGRRPAILDLVILNAAALFGPIVRPVLSPCNG